MSLSGRQPREQQQKTRCDCPTCTCGGQLCSITHRTQAWNRHKEAEAAAARAAAQRDIALLPALGAIAVDRNGFGRGIRTDDVTDFALHAEEQRAKDRRRHDADVAAVECCLPNLGGPGSHGTMAMASAADVDDDAGSLDDAPLAASVYAEPLPGPVFLPEPPDDRNIMSFPGTRSDLDKAFPDHATLSFPMGTRIPCTWSPLGSDRMAVASMLPFDYVSDSSVVAPVLHGDPASGAGDGAGDVTFRRRFLGPMHRLRQLFLTNPYGFAVTHCAASLSDVDGCGAVFNDTAGKPKFRVTCLDDACRAAAAKLGTLGGTAVAKAKKALTEVEKTALLASIGRGCSADTISDLTQHGINGAIKIRAVKVGPSFCQ